MLIRGSSLTTTGASTVTFVGAACAFVCVATVSSAGGVVGAVLAWSSVTFAAHALPVFVVPTGARGARAFCVFDPDARFFFLLDFGFFFN